MSFLSRTLFLAVVILLVQGTTTLRAQQMGALNQSYISRLSGSDGSLVENGNVSLTYTPGTESSRLIKNIITLSLNEQSSAYLSVNFSASVTVTVDYGPSSGSTSSFSQVLTVTYNKLGGVSYNPRNYVSFNKAQVCQGYRYERDHPPVNFRSGVQTLQAY